jgi:hypothetical protein
VLAPSFDRRKLEIVCRVEGYLSTPHSDAVRDAERHEYVPDGARVESLGEEFLRVVLHIVAVQICELVRSKALAETRLDDCLV